MFHKGESVQWCATPTSEALSHVEDALPPDAVITDQDGLARLQQIGDESLHPRVATAARQQRVVAVGLEQVLQALLDLCSTHPS